MTPAVAAVTLMMLLLDVIGTLQITLIVESASLGSVCRVSTGFYLAEIVDVCPTS
jgi:hypothetical protein